MPQVETDVSTKERNEVDSSGTPFSMRRVAGALLIVVLIVSPVSLSLTIEGGHEPERSVAVAYCLYVWIVVPACMMLAFQKRDRSLGVTIGVGYCFYYFVAMLLIPNDAAGESTGWWMTFCAFPASCAGLLLGIVLLLLARPLSMSEAGAEFNETNSENGSGTGKVPSEGKFTQAREDDPPSRWVWRRGCWGYWRRGDR